MKVIKKVQSRGVGIYLVIALLLVISTGIYYLYFNNPANQSARASLITPPVIREISNEQLRIVWETDQPVAGSLYLLEVEGERVLKEAEETRYHQILLTGLEPETDYKYRLSAASEDYYTFRTPPQPETAFRLLLFQQEGFLNSSWIKKFIETSNTQIPDLAVVAGLPGGDNGDNYEGYLERERAFFKAINKNTLGLPVYLIPGPEMKLNFYFDYGNTRFIILRPVKAGPVPIEEGENITYSDRKNLLEEIIFASRQKHTIMISSSFDQSSETDKSFLTYLQELADAGEVEALINLACRSYEQFSVDGKVFNITDGFMVVDVDGEGITGGIGNFNSPEMSSVVIKDYPEAVKRSCVYCRKLIEKEKYQESIQWYRDFIADYGEEYVVDDSQFEIANIYDRYLYDYGNALKEYNALIEKYQNSNKARQAKHRIEYLASHSDYDFKPLQIFEKAKMETFVEDEAAAVAEIESVLDEYPDSSLEPQLLDWLGRTLVETDLERSLTYLKRLASGDYGEAYRQDTRIAIGDAYYTNMKYQEAIDAYQRVEPAVNGSALADKIARSRRNINRDRLRTLFISFLSFLTVAAIFIKPVGFRKNEVRLSALLAVLYPVSGLVFWRIFFSENLTLLYLILALTIAGAVVPMLVSALNRKLLTGISGIKGFYKKLLIAAVAMLASLSTIYLVIYYCWMHYLTVFRL